MESKVTACALKRAAISRACATPSAVMPGTELRIRVAIRDVRAMANQVERSRSIGCDCAAAMPLTSMKHAQDEHSDHRHDS